MKKKLIVLFALAILLIPIVSFGLVVPKLAKEGIEIDLVRIISELLGNIIWPIIVAVTVIMFLVAGFKFLTAQGAPDKLKEAKSAVIWGIAGVVVIVLSFSIIKIVGILTGTIDECKVNADCVPPNVCDAVGAVNKCVPPVPPLLNDGQLCDNGAQCKSGVCAVFIGQGPNPTCGS